MDLPTPAIMPPRRVPSPAIHATVAVPAAKASFMPAFSRAFPITLVTALLPAPSAGAAAPAFVMSRSKNERD